MPDSHFAKIDYPGPKTPPLIIEICSPARYISKLRGIRYPYIAKIKGSNLIIFPCKNIADAKEGIKNLMASIRAKARAKDTYALAFLDILMRQYKSSFE